jgi:acyl carrier protein
MMTTETTVKSKTAVPFPTKEIEACIRDFLAEEGAMQAALRGQPATQSSTLGSIGPQPTIDSLVIVEILIELESKLPFALPECLVRAGEYDNVDQVVQHLMPKLQQR